MLAIECPRCGRPTRVELYRPDQLRCLACHYQGPPGTHARTAIDSAARLLGTVDVRQRQLSERQRRTLSRMRQFRWLLLGLLVFGLVVLAPCALCGLVFLTGREAPIPAIACASPFLFLATTGGAVVLWSFRNGRRLENACAALPPDVEGEPAACHVCGGALEADIDAGGFVRCTFCAADNLVARDILARQARRKVGEVGRLDEEVKHQATSVGLESGVSCVVVLLLALVAPAVCIGTAVGLVVVTRQIEDPVDPDEQYVAVDTPDGPCVARMDPFDEQGRRKLSVWGGRTDYSPTTHVEGDDALHPTFGADGLVGRRVRFQRGRDWIGGSVLRVYSPPLTSGNFAVVATGGEEERLEIEKLCFEQPQPDLDAIPWPDTPQPAPAAGDAGGAAVPSDR